MGSRAVAVPPVRPDAGAQCSSAEKSRGRAALSDGSEITVHHHHLTACAPKASAGYRVRAGAEQGATRIRFGPAREPRARPDRPGELSRRVAARAAARPASQDSLCRMPARPASSAGRDFSPAGGPLLLIWSKMVSGVMERGGLSSNEFANRSLPDRSDARSPRSAQIFHSQDW